MATASASSGLATPTVGPGAAGISPSRRAAISVSLSAFLDRELGGLVTRALGPSVDIGQLASLTASLKTGLHAKLGASLGVTGGTSAGGVGGSAGGGLSLAAGAGATSKLAGGATGNLGGVASGGLSLGAGLGTRATSGFGVGGKVPLGIAVGGKFGVGAQSGLGGTGDSPVKVGAGASIKENVTQALDSAMRALGLSGEEQAAVKSDLQPAINHSVDDSFKSAFGPDPGYPHARGVALLGCECTMQHTGPWHAICEIDHVSNDQEIATGPFIFDIDGVEFRGTVVPDRSSAFGGRQSVKVVGGAGGLDAEIPARDYAGGQVLTVVTDILRDAGESLSVEADDDFLDRRLGGWTRSKGTASHALDMVCQKIGCEWRVLRDGTVWLGADEWPEVDPSGTVMDQDLGAGIVTVAPDAATLVPGIIVRGQQVHQVTHRLGERGLRTDLHAKSHRQLVDKFLQRTERKSQFGYRYRCKVTRQNADGTVDVITDDERMKGRGVSKCRIRVGTPGTTIKVPAGARCLVGWDDADPSLPYVDGWESGTEFISIDFG